MRRQRRFRRGQHLRALDVIDQRQQRRRRQHVDIAGPGGFPALNGGTHDAAPGGIGADRRRQHARHRRKTPVEREFAENGVVLERVRRDHVHRHQQRHGDRQVEMRAFLQHVGGDEIDGDALGRQGKPHGRQRRAHPFAALRDRLVGQADDVERDHARRQLHLAVDIEHVDAVEGDGMNAGDHTVAPLLRGRRCVRVCRTCGVSITGAGETVHCMYPLCSRERNRNIKAVQSVSAGRGGGNT